MRLLVKRENYILAIVVLSFILLNAINLSVLDFNFDEGMYIYHSRLIKEGKIPCKDFFSHQPPLYPIILSIFTSYFPNSLFMHRFLSLLSTAITGILVFLISRRFVSDKIAVFSTVLFYFAPLQHYSKLALPYGPMILFSTLAFYLLLIENRARYTLLSSICMVIAILLKPIAISTFFSFALILFLLKKYRGKLKPFLLTFVVAMLFIFLLMNIWTEGNILKLIEAQTVRSINFSGFEFAKGIRSFNNLLYENNIHSAIEWNLYSHKHTFLYTPFKNINFYLLLVALVGVPAMLFKFHRRRDLEMLPLLAWIIIPFLFSIFIWAPSWEHYYIQYLPVLSIMAAFSAQQLNYKFKNRRVYILLFTMLLVYAFFGALNSNTNWDFYDRVGKLNVYHNDKLLTLNPLINFLTHTGPVCGITDPLNQYAPFGKVFIGDNNDFSSKLIGDDQIISCIESEPNIKIVIEEWFVLLSSRRLWEYIRKLDQKRLLYLYSPNDIEDLDAKMPEQIF